MKKCRECELIYKYSFIEIVRQSLDTRDIQPTSEPQ